MSTQASPFPFPDDSLKKWTPGEVAAVLNRLLFVAWDRMIAAPVIDSEGGEHRCLSVYGWISRADAHHDFVLLTFVSWDEAVAYSTSSAERSKEINAVLAGADAPHHDCVRVEDVLSTLVARKVVLSS